MTTTTTTTIPAATTTLQHRTAGPVACPPGYHLRRGLSSDVDAVTSLYRASFGRDSLLDVLFPTRDAHPRDFHAHIYRHFQARWWTLGWDLTVLVDDALGVPVGFTWWRRPLDQLSFTERWLSPCELRPSLVKGPARAFAMCPVTPRLSPTSAAVYTVSPD